jgi:hypothetical protein
VPRRSPARRRPPPTEPGSFSHPGSRQTTAHPTSLPRPSTSRTHAPACAHDSHSQAEAAPLGPPTLRERLSHRDEPWSRVVTHQDLNRRSPLLRARSSFPRRASVSARAPATPGRDESRQRRRVRGSSRPRYRIEARPPPGPDPTALPPWTTSERAGSTSRRRLLRLAGAGVRGGRPGALGARPLRY